MLSTREAGRYICKRCHKCGETTSLFVVSVNYRLKVSTVRGFLPVCELDGAGAAAYENGRVLTSCRGCGAPVWAARVIGKVSLVHECGARCLTSKGPSCECSCGGRNHGAGYAS